MSRLDWRDTDLVQVAGGAVSVAKPPGRAGLQSPGTLEKAVKSIIWPAYKALTDPLFDGYIEDFGRRMIAQYWTRDSTFLEISCGDCGMARFLPRDAWYNAFDFRLNEIFLANLFQQHPRSNVALASVESIPLADESVDFLVCLQALFEYPDFDRAVRELCRVARRGAKLVCSTFNARHQLYARRGIYPDAKQTWTYDQLVADMERHGFALLHGEKRGLWIRTPRLLTDRAVTVPFASTSEENALTFLYVFEKC
jgi:SAM-dependent methyltransferase